MDPSDRIVADKVVLLLYNAPYNRLYLSDIIGKITYNNQHLLDLLETLRNKTIIEMPESTGYLTNPLVQLTNLGLILGSKLEANNQYLNNYKVLGTIRSLGRANADWNERYPMIHQYGIGHKKAQFYALIVLGVVMLLLWVLHQIELM